MLTAKQSQRIIIAGKELASHLSPNIKQNPKPSAKSNHVLLHCLSYSNPRLPTLKSEKIISTNLQGQLNRMLERAVREERESEQFPHAAVISIDMSRCCWGGRSWKQGCVDGEGSAKTSVFITSLRGPRSFVRSFIVWIQKLSYSKTPEMCFPGIVRRYGLNIQVPENFMNPCRAPKIIFYLFLETKEVYSNEKQA